MSGPGRPAVRPLARAGAVAGVLGALLAGCGAPDPAPAPAPPPSAAGPTAGAPTPEETVCADYRTQDSVLRQTADAVERMAVLPAGLSLLLLNVRQVAQTPGVEDVALAAAQLELVAAIDDLDAQGRALLGPDGNAATDAVRLDAQRIQAAVDEIERICGAA